MPSYHYNPITFKFIVWVALVAITRTGKLLPWTVFKVNTLCLSGLYTHTAKNKACMVVLTSEFLP